MTAMSFSMPVTVPLTTRSSKPPFSPPSDSFNIAAKSSREGCVVEAIKYYSLQVVAGQSVVSGGLWPNRSTHRMYAPHPQKRVTFGRIWLNKRKVTIDLAKLLVKSHATSPVN